MGRERRGSLGRDGVAGEREGEDRVERRGRQGVVGREEGEAG